MLCQGLRRALSDRPDALNWIEDFAQDSALCILQDIHQFRGDSHFTTWALSIAMRTAFDELRRKRWKDISLDVLISTGDTHHPSTLQTTERDLDRQKLFTTLRHAIDTQLTVKQRKALIAEFKEMPQLEIARQLGTTRNAVYKLTHDARKSLKSKLAEAGITAEMVRWALTTEGAADEA